MNGSSVRAPIVLVHGVLGFSEITLPGLTIPYFRGIPQALRAAGNTVPVPPQLSKAGSVKERAAQLKPYLLNDPDVAGQPVHLFAHSLGGLDARWLISRLDMAGSVLTLTTLGTPHRGSPVADVGVEFFGPLLTTFQDVTGLSIQGFFDLTTQNFQEFNQEAVPDAPGVRYFSVAGQYQPHPLDLLAPTQAFLQEKEGANDGFVSVQSATYGESCEVWDGNHFRLINWPTNLVAPPGQLEDQSIVNQYLALVQGLAEKNF